MKYLGFAVMAIGLSACNLAAPGGSGGGGSAATGGGMREQLVLGSNMSFAQCQARGGLIIRDAGSPMVACDPRVQGPKIPQDEFNHPAAQPGQVAPKS